MGQENEPRKELVWSADLVSDTEGNTVSRVTASAASAPRGQWPWHAQTLLAREPGDLSTGRRSWRAAVCVGEAEDVAADDVRAAEVGLLHSTDEAGEQRPVRACGVGGGKAGGLGQEVPAKHVPDSVPGLHVTGASASTHSYPAAG